ncbi:MAG: hypothetical protein WC878_07895 [Candidatus Paceibacterota bacterium]
MPQEKPNLNKIWNAGKLFEPKPEPEQPAKQSESEPNPSNVKRKKSVIGAFMDKQEDPFKQKVEAVLKEVEETKPTSANAVAGKEEKPIPPDAEVIDGTGQDEIGRNLSTGKSILVKGDAGNWTGYSMSDGEIRVKGNAASKTGDHMSGGEIYIGGDAGWRTGDHMSGGEIHVEGDAGNETGHSMSSGKIHVKGAAGNWTGLNMFGGTLRVDSDVESFNETAFSSKNKGTIIWKGETIWQDGKKVEPGWTKLNVDEKIEK